MLSSGMSSNVERIAGTLSVPEVYPADQGVRFCTIASAIVAVTLLSTSTETSLKQVRT